MKLEIFVQLSEGKIVGHLSDEMHKVNNKSVVYLLLRIRWIVKQSCDEKDC